MSALLGQVARACARHPWRTIGIWVVALVAIVMLAGSASGRSVDDFRLPGSDAQRGLDLLDRSFRAESGSSALLVFHSREGALTDAASQGDVRATLARVARLDHVVAVSDPYTTGGVSPDETIGRAGVRYDERTNDLGRRAYSDLRDAVRSDRSGIDVEIGGPLAAWEQDDGSTELLGFLAAMIVLTLVFGSVLAMLLPIGVAVAAVLAGQLLVTLLAGFIDVPSSTPQLALMIGLGVALDYSLFIVSRYLDRVRAGAPPVVAAGDAVGTAGVAVLFAGLTVMIAISSLALAGVWAIGVIGFAVAMAVAVTVVAALTLLPGLLGLLGRRANVSRSRFLARSAAHEYRSSRRWASTVVRRPVLTGAAALVVLLALASPVLALRLGQTDAGTQPPETSQRRAFDLLARGFGPGFNGPLLLVAHGAGLDAPSAMADVAAAVERDPDVAGVGEPRFNPAHRVAVLEVFPRTSPHADETTALVERLRDQVIPESTPSNLQVFVTGQTAAAVDLADQMSARLPVVIGSVVLVSVLLLLVGFRSIVVAVKAAIMNILSIGVGYGVLVAVFQWGWAKGLIGLPETVPIVSWVPLVMFAILFGLSMDYEVFLISAIRDAYQRHHDHRRAVVEGLSSTARVITGAAVIMLVVFGAFVAFPDPVVKMIGLGLAVSILVDATIVRMALVPATMTLLGDANWWLPRWLDRALPTLDFDGQAVEPDDVSPDSSIATADDEREPVSVTR